MTRFKVVHEGQPSSSRALFDVYKEVKEEVLGGIGWRQRPYNSAVPEPVYRAMLREQKHVFGRRMPQFDVEVNGVRYHASFVDDDNLFHKYSNIVHLKRDDGRRLVLRESRVYDPAGEELKELEALAKPRRYDKGWYEAVAAGDMRPPAAGKFIFIPEPNLIGAAKTIAKEFPSLGIVPRFVAVDTDGQTVYTVRNYLPESALDDKKDFMAKVWYLQLCMYTDSDPGGIQVFDDAGNGPVIVDPDFVLHRASSKSGKRGNYPRGVTASEYLRLKHENPWIKVKDTNARIQGLRECYGDVNVLDFVPVGQELDDVLFDESHYQAALPAPIRQYVLQASEGILGRIA